MKTVSGKVLSCQQMSLSKAAKYISRFTASDNQASPAFAAYLRRTSAAFDELVQLHKEYKTPLDESSRKNDHSSATANSVQVVGKGKRKTLDEVNEDAHSRNVHIYDSASIGVDVVVQDGGRSVEGDVPNVHTGLKKSKKKKDRDGKKMDDVVNEMRRLDASEETNFADAGKKPKKKMASNVDKVELNGVDDDIKVSEVKREMSGLGESEQMKTNLPDVGVTVKKSKKKKGNDVAAASNDAINPDVVDNKASVLDASEESKKKNKNKRDKHQNENHTGATKTLKDSQLHPAKEGADTGEAGDTAHNNVDERKKHKKKKSKIKDDKNVRNEVKEEKESNTIRSAEQIREMISENKHKVLGEKRQRHEAEVRENGSSVEIEAAGKKENRKRKHERVADGEFAGSQEAVRSKKKKL